MFGGAGVYRDGLMFALVSDSEIYLKADEETAERFRAAGSRPFVYSREGKQATMSYWSMPDEALDDPDLVGEWAEIACEAARRASMPRKKGPAAVGGGPSPGPPRRGSAPGRPSGRRAGSRRGK
jgi:DNA transformation protein